MTGHTIGRLSIFIWRHVTPMLLILTFSSILTVGILDGFRYEVWTHRSVSTIYLNNNDISGYRDTSNILRYILIVE